MNVDAVPRAGIFRAAYEIKPYRNWELGLSTRESESIWRNVAVKNGPGDDADVFISCRSLEPNELAGKRLL